MQLTQGLIYLQWNNSRNVEWTAAIPLHQLAIPTYSHTVEHLYGSLISNKFYELYKY
jgi:hypothetical protein